MGKNFLYKFYFDMHIHSENCHSINFKSYLKNPIKVDRKLIRGSCVTSPLKLLSLKKEGVTQIIDLRNSSFKKPLEKLWCKIFNIKYVDFKYPHRLNNLPQRDFFEKVNNTILENNGTTYIHCEKGKRRSGMCQAFYELSCSKKSLAHIKMTLLDCFQEFLVNPQTKRAKKYQKIFNEFIEK